MKNNKEASVVELIQGRNEMIRAVVQELAGPNSRVPCKLRILILLWVRWEVIRRFSVKK